MQDVLTASDLEISPVLVVMVGARACAFALRAFDVVLNTGVLFALNFATPCLCFSFGFKDFGGSGLTGAANKCSVVGVGGARFFVWCDGCHCALLVCSSCVISRLLLHIDYTFKGVVSISMRVSGGYRCPFLGTNTKS